MRNNSQYQSLVDDYEKEKSRNQRIKFVEVFPSRKHWIPSFRSLLPSDHKLLHGPAPDITVLKRVQFRVPNTGRLITYCSAPFEVGKRARVSSAYVCLNHQQHSEIPQFGHIIRLFSHEFGDKSTLFAEANVFDLPQFNGELKMWFTNLDPKACESAMFPLKAFSEPLVIAVDEKNSIIWFLNYKCNM